MRCVITGATGFIGRTLIPHLRSTGHEVIAWPRQDTFDLGHPAATPPDEWVALLHGADAVIHLAGLAHQHTRAAAEYFRINRDGTALLAGAAQIAGVRRFIFMSSAKVFGEGGTQIYDETSAPAPMDAYAESKWQAEQHLRERAGCGAFEFVILRPPLVYGGDARANFGSLIRLARLPLPLPFAGVDNRRALIGIDNLVDLIGRCLACPEAAGRTLLCADAELYSLPAMINAIRRALNREPGLFRIPQPALGIIKALLGNAVSSRLFGDFRMDCSATCTLLNWSPPKSMETILRDSFRGRVQ